MAEPEGSLLSPSCVPDSMGSLARHLVIPTLKTDFHREGIFRPSANRKRLSFAPTLTLTLTLTLVTLGEVGLQERLDMLSYGVLYKLSAS